MLYLHPILQVCPVSNKGIWIFFWQLYQLGQRHLQLWLLHPPNHPQTRPRFRVSSRRNASKGDKLTRIGWMERRSRSNLERRDSQHWSWCVFVVVFLSLHCKGISKSWGLGCTKGGNGVMLPLHPTLLSKQNRLIMTFQYCLIAYVRQEWPPFWVRVGPLSFKDYWLWVVFFITYSKTIFVFCVINSINR